MDCTCENGRIGKVLWHFKSANGGFGKCGLPESTATGAESGSFGVNPTVHFSAAFSTSQMWASVINVPVLLESRIPLKDVKCRNLKNTKNPRGFLFQYKRKVFFLNMNVS